MAGSRTLKLSILADVADLRKGLQDSSGEVEGFGGKVADFGKKAGLAFAAAGAAAAAYAGKLLIDGVKAAIEDEQAQIKLATALKNTTGASEAQIASVEKYITKTALATGVTDDQLRPSLERLTRATKDVEEAQKLQQLALDVSAGSGKSLEQISVLLSKAYEGNVGALAKLNLGVDAATLKTMSFDQATALLSQTFGGQASVQADTFAGKMTRLNVAFDEAKETVGSYVLDAITPLVSNFVDNVIPAISETADEIGTNLSPIITDLTKFFKESLIPIFKEFWSFLVEILIPGIVKTVRPVFEGLLSVYNKIANTIKENEDNLRPLLNLYKAIASFVVEKLAPALGTILGAALKVVGSLISGLISGFAKLVGFITDVINRIRDLINLVRNNPLVQGISGLISSVFGGGRADGGAVKAGTAYMVGERGKELFVPQTDGRIVPNDRLGGGGVVNNYTINVSGALDPIGVARTISNVLGREATISGTFTNLGVSRVFAT